MNAKTSLRAFNLNTLPILREILRQGSVGKAAKALNVSQPALSGALKQLRHQFNDELIVRSHGTIKLTRKAEAMLAPLEKALSAVQELMMQTPEEANQPPTVLRIAANDHIMNLLGAPIVQILLQEKLKVMPHFVSVGGHTPAQVLSGDVDFVIMNRIALAGSQFSSSELGMVNSEPLFSEPLVGIARRGDLLIAAGLSVQEYLERPHVSFDLDPEKNRTSERNFLAANSLQQNDIAKFSCYSALVGIVATTQCIALVPASLARSIEFMVDIQQFEPPLQFPPLDYTMVWHRRNDDDERFAQCRTILKSLFQNADEEFKYGLR